MAFAPRRWSFERDVGTQPDETYNESQSEKNVHFLKAIISNDENKVLESIKAGVDIDFVYHGKAALFYAVSGGNGKIVEALVKAGANVNITDDDGKTPLFYCAEKRHREEYLWRFRRPVVPMAYDHEDLPIDYNTADSVASTLIKAGADVNITDDAGKTALMYALQNKKVRLACQLIDSGADVKTIDENGRTALFYPSICENMNVLQNLMKNVDINSTDRWGKTALMVAVEQNQESTVAELIKAGANVNVTDKNGKTALMYCTHFQIDEQYIVNHRVSLSRRRFSRFARVPSPSTIHFNNCGRVISECKKCILSVLIKAGADMNKRDHLGKTSLIYCIQEESPEQTYSVEYKYLKSTIDFKGLASELIKSGADVNITDNEGKTALMYSLQEDNESLACALIEAGADVKMVDKTGKNALFYATVKGYKNVFSKLAHSIDINVIDNQGKTVLMYAVQRVNRSFVSELIDSGAETNIADKDGKTALMYSLQEDNESLACALIEAGADVNITDKEGKTALMYSLQEDNKSLACALIEAGADVKMVDKTGKNALFYATVKGYKNLFSKLAHSTDINVIDNQGKTVLMYVVQCVNRSFVSELIDSGAETNIADKDGKTALIYCALSLLKLKEGVRRIGYKMSQEDYQAKIDTSTSKVITVASMLIKSGADVNMSDNEGKTALNYSLQVANDWLSSALIKAGADLSIMDKNGKTVLFYAVLYNRKSLVQDLIDAGVDVNSCDYEGKTALIYFAQHRNKSREQDLVILRYFMSRNHVGDCPGSDTNDHNTVASTLIKSFADVNVTDNKGRTALIYSLLNGNQDLACTLIEAGADVNVVDHDGHTALFYALISNRERVQKLMRSQTISDSEGETDSSLSAQDSKCLVIKLINAGADVNLAYDKGKTALIYSAEDGNKSLVSALIKAGADVNAADNEDKTALIHCTCYGDSKRFCTNNDDIAFALIKAGANVNVADNKGKTALIYCIIHNNNEDMVSRLIEAGADANITDHDGSSAIFYGVGNDKIVHLLINKGKANINKRDHYGRTPLYYAMNESLTSARHLFDNESGLRRKDCYGILSFFIEHCLKQTVHMSEGLNLLQEKGIQQEAIFEALVNSLFCRILDLQGGKQHGSLSQKPDLRLIVQVLNIALKYAREGKCEFIQNLIVMIEKSKNSFKASLKILESLVKLGANPSYADIDGNTALHYAVCLPLAGVSQDTVMKICNQLDDLGASVCVQNHQKETPLLFCLSKKEWVIRSHESSKLMSLVEVCSFLLDQGSRSLEETTQNRKSVFHLIMELFDQGLCLHSDVVRKDVLNESLTLLHLFSSSHVTKGVTVNIRDNNLNSPLHLWAMLELRFPSALHPQAFEKQIIAAIFKHLVDCGAKLNDGNKMDQTPLHLCKTWTAAKLLIDAGAKTNVLDSEGSPPLLVTIKRNQNVIDKSDASCIYPDVLQQPKEFWKTVVENKLNPWTVNNDGSSVMSILVESEAFALANALLDVACEGNDIQTDAIAVSLLNAICKDQSTSAQWKSILVGQILKSRKSTIHQRDGEETPLHYCCRNIARKITEDLPFRQRRFHNLDDPLVNDMMTSVHWTIVKQLLLHGFNSSALDTSGQSCTDIAKTCPALKDLLTKPLNIDELPLVIPWKSISKMHKTALAKVARKQECEQVSSFWYQRNKYLQKGSFGTVLVGINEKDGREVAIKRIEKLRMHRPEEKREITSLTALADCEQVVRYLFFDEDLYFFYIVLELMEGNLTDYLGGTYFDAKKSTLLCADVVQGLKYLHDQGIIHRDLKPSNILFKTFPKLCLKIADFGLSRCIDKCSTSATVYGSVAGTRCWIAPEVLKSSYKEHSKASEVFSCGLLLYYVLMDKRHPFSPVDCANKSELQIYNETEANVLSNSREGWDSGLFFPEAIDLINSMLDSVKTKRPTAAEALVHPMFWPKKKKMEFLIAVANQPEVECPRAKKVPPLTPVEDDLENSFSTIVTEKTWDDSAYVNMPAIYAEMTKKRKKYDTFSVVELVRFIRNTRSHVSEDKRPTSIRKLVLEDFVFLEYFPNLVTEVFKCIKTHGWDLRDEIKHALDE